MLSTLHASSYLNSQKSEGVGTTCYYFHFAQQKTGFEDFPQDHRTLRRGGFSPLPGCGRNSPLVGLVNMASPFSILGGRGRVPLGHKSVHVSTSAAQKVKLGQEDCSQDPGAVKDNRVLEVVTIRLEQRDFSAGLMHGQKGRSWHASPGSEVLRLLETGLEFLGHCFFFFGTGD